MLGNRSTGRTLLDVQGQLLNLTNRVAALEMAEAERDSEDRHIFGSMDNLRDLLMAKFATIENRIANEMLSLQSKFEILEIGSRQERHRELTSLFKGVVSIRLGLSKLQLDTQHYCHLPSGTPQDVPTSHAKTFTELLKLMNDHEQGDQPFSLSEVQACVSKLVQPDDLRPLSSTDSSIAAVAINKQVNHHIRGNSTALASEREILLQRVREIEAVLKTRAEAVFRFEE